MTSFNTSRVRRHVTREMMTFAERLAADVALKLVVLLLLDRIELALVMRTHVVDEVGGHSKARVALGAPVLSEVESGERRLDRTSVTRRRRSAADMQHLVDHRVGTSIDERQSETRVGAGGYGDVAGRQRLERRLLLLLLVLNDVVVVEVLESVERGGGGVERSILVGDETGGGGEPEAVMVTRMVVDGESRKPGEEEHAAGGGSGSGSSEGTEVTRLVDAAG